MKENYFKKKIRLFKNIISTALTMLLILFLVVCAIIFFDRQFGIEKKINSGGLVVTSKLYKANGILSDPTTQIITTKGSFYIKGVCSVIDGKAVSIISYSNGDRYLKIQDMDNEYLIIK